MAKEVTMMTVDEENEAAACSASDQQKAKKCMFSTTSIDECCPTFKSILGISCSCYKYAEDLDNQVLITLEAYCDVSSPCKGVPSPPPPPSKSPPPAPEEACAASNQDKLKKCMLQTIVTDECCPTFKSILMHSCPCYKYAEKFDNQAFITLRAYCDVGNPCKSAQNLITLKAYCDVGNPCKSAQVIKLSNDE
ncbi:putative latent-transforming growth factor beta-binding protein 4-like [Capsicum annuum]|nr:putative latent-transforming growth factor beta-binding protein 4-like [Capsicum annuum]KAF3653435.1 putative latent-transforming growth factor beta-binding protein 4-like [Capsicum annuum]